ncbi:hypothetical protein MKW94_026855 [Papaver nudicaule]|uniref:Uncharacterized protein n=1 Tax=Papaver nudicaule TaxID=74823 RepID=A0AA41RV44_PAPNU|nr:hypothetical protein [Papaver nudicaule]
MAAVDQSSSSPPRKVARKIRVGGMIFTRTVVCGGCKVKYVIQRIESECFRISDGKTTRDVPFSRKHINFDCPCGERFEITMNVTMNLSLAEKKEWERKLNGKT